MKIELKNVKLFLAGSEETICFTATLYVDGKKVGDASNDGRGGNNRVHAPRDVLDRLDAYCRTLPSKPNEFHPGETWQPDLDSVISDIVNEHVKKHEEKRIARMDAREKAKLVALGCKTVIRINFKDGLSLWTGTRGTDIKPLLAANEEKHGPIENHIVL